MQLHDEFNYDRSNTREEKSRLKASLEKVVALVKASPLPAELQKFDWVRCSIFACPFATERP